MKKLSLLQSQILGATYCIAVFLAPSIANCQAAFAGQYIGQVQIEYTGTITSGPNSAGLTSFTVRADGTVAELGNDLIGTVDSGGTITWQTPNPFNFTTGTIAGEILSSSGSTTANGLTITASINIPKAGAQFPPGESFGGQITDLNPVNGYLSMNALALAGDGFVAAGGSGSLILSDDGVNWRRSAAPTTKRLNGVAFGNGLYITGGDDGAYFTSADGNEWTNRTSPFNSNFVDIRHMAFGNGVFIATSSTRGGARSTDGITWTSAGGGFDGVRFLNGEFVKLSSSALQFSTDGITWSSSVFPSVGNSIADITFGDGMWVVAGNQYISTSTNKSTWTRSYPASGTANVSQLDFGNGRFIARTAGGSGTYLYSNDAITWTIANSAYNSSLVSTAYANGRFIGAGSELIESIDGKNWSRSEKNKLVLSAVDFQEGTPGNFSYFLENLILTGSDSISSVMKLNTRIGSRTGVQLYAGDDGKFFIDQSSTDTDAFVDMGTTADLYAISSSLGSTPEHYAGGEGGVIKRVLRSGFGASSSFSSEDITSPTTNTLRYGKNFGFNGSSVIDLMVGDGGTIVRIERLVGQQPAASLVPSGTTANLRFITEVDNGRIGTQRIAANVIVGENGTILLRNSETESWSSQVSGTIENLIGISFVNPFFVVMSETGGIFTSQDLITWSAAERISPPGKITRFSNGVGVGDLAFYTRVFSSNGGLRFEANALSNFGPYSGESLAFGGGKYLNISRMNASVSSNGKDWETCILPLSPNAAGYGSGKFVAVGRDIYFSEDGLVWEQASSPLPGSLILASITYGNGKFIASGSRGGVLTSTEGETWTPVGGEPFTSGSIVSLVHNGVTFVGVGDDKIIVSTDSGDSFTTAGAAGASGLVSVAWGNGIFVAVGSNGNTIRSTNGTSWQRLQIPSSQSNTGSRPSFNEVVYANDNFIAFTGDGQAYVSGDGGQTWTEKFSGLGGYFFTDSLVANGLIVLASDQGIVGIAVEDNSPYVTSQPQPTTLNAGTPLNLSVTVSGTNPLAYQWFQNGAPLANGGSVSGANGATLTINNISPGFSGTYQVTVTNPDGSRTSKEAVVIVEGSAVVGFDAWKAGFTFPVGEDGPLDDPDGDGVQNLLEFVSGSNPVTSGPSFLPSSGTISGSQIGSAADVSKNYLTFQARVRKDRPGINLVPQSGNTLADFTNANVAQVGVPVDDPSNPDFEIITYYHTVAIEDSVSKKAFLRIGVSL